MSKHSAARHQLACYRHAIDQARSWLLAVEQSLPDVAFSSAPNYPTAEGHGHCCGPFAARRYEIRQARYWLRMAGYHLSRYRCYLRGTR
jgi:hypothetical protein